MDDRELLVQAANHLSRGKHADAFSIYDQLSAKGYPTCQIYAGWMLFEGVGVGVDQTKAMKYFKAAAEQGEAAGMFYVGKALAINGRHEEAFSWYQRAAQQYYSPALFRVGVSYLHGIGVAPNKVLGYSCLEEAAGAGHVLARGQLAKGYLSGDRGLRMVPKGVRLLIQTAIDAWRFAGRRNEFVVELLG